VVLALGQDLQVQISSAFSQNLTYNVITTTNGSDTTALHTKLNTIPGLSKSRTDTFTQAMPIAINGKPLQQALPKAADDRQSTIQFLSTVEGYDLAHSAPSATMTQGRTLNASDAGTNNVLISDLLTSSGPFGMHLKPGDTITLASADGKTQKTLTVVGIYPRTSGGDHVGSVLAASGIVNAFSSAKTGLTTVTYMKIDQAQVNNALDKLATIVPNATVQNLADIGAYIAQLLNSILDMLVAIASLSVIAGVIIIANAVALAMLERRRELGILKAVGYTSNTVLSEVMIENGIVGGVGALLAMLLTTGAILLLGNLLFSVAFSVSALIVLSLIGGSVLLAMLTAALVAWGSVRVRPLEVLRYE